MTLLHGAPWALVRSTKTTSTYNPLETGYLRRTFGLPTYVGDNRVLSSGSEAIVTIGSALQYFGWY